MGTKAFHEIFGDEVAAISKRRARHRLRPIELEEEGTARDGTPVLRPTVESGVVGLSLSGGGIRSAAFCLGVLQALDSNRLIEKIDYLSSVSGGGYIGTSLTAAMSSDPTGRFPFTSQLREGEVPGVQHIRDHSNYLFPQGVLNLFGNIVVYLRGLVANAVLILPVLLLAAAGTIWSNPTVDSLSRTDIIGFTLKLPISVAHFGVTANALLAFVLLLAAWALWRSTRRGRIASDVGGWGRWIGLILLVILVVAFCELQPALLNGMFRLAHQPGGDVGLVGATTATIKWLAALFAPIAAVVGFLGKYLADFLKKANDKPGFAAAMSRVTAKLLMYVAGAAVPLVLWVAYLYLSFWGVEDPACVVLVTPGGSCPYQAPAWLMSLAQSVPFAGPGLLRAYVIVGVVLIAIGCLLSPNANSLHRLYRDRLSKAFLFDPNHREGEGAPDAGMTERHDLQPLDRFKVSELEPERAPYHLINAALNIGGSKYANRRGRNADFFFFSPLFSGSEATGYIETAILEQRERGLTAGTALAISGAAASSNMGSATIKPLTPTLAMLNVRLGYWMINPAAAGGRLAARMFAGVLDKLYFFNEMFGRLSEEGKLVYLTDGGHVENLGIYELLRRRCRLIIAVDAEADAEMSFGALVKLERYARIDLGVRIDLPWAAIRDSTRLASKEIAETGGLPPDQAHHGPHVALGSIYYPWGKNDRDEDEHTGVLLYVKSSLSGDESDYIDYKRRYPEFPHETTADQLFSEEQFEVYRALGFHALYDALRLKDVVSMRPKPAQCQGEQTTDAVEARLRAVLGLPLKPAPEAGAATSH